MIDPGLIVFGIQALVRLGREGKTSIDQFERDRKLLFPQPLPVDFTDNDLVVRVFANNDANSVLVDKAQNGPLARFWDADNERPDPRVPGAAEVLYLEAVRIRSVQAAKNGQILPLRGMQVAGAIIVTQWADGKAPVGPLGRLVLAMADVGLEFVGTHASVLGIGGNAEKLVAALALNLADLIPADATQLGSQSRLAERLLSIFLRAGLSVIADKPDLVIGAPHLRELVANTLPPIIKELPKDLAAQASWENVANALLGPAAGAAMQTIAANPVGFLGARFDAEKAIGALTGALLREASARTLQDTFSEAGFIALYRAALGVAATRPQLFVGRADSSDKIAKLAADLIGGAAEQMRKAPVPFNGDLGALLAAAAVEALAQNAAAFLDRTQPWEATALTMAQLVGLGLRPALASGHVGASSDQLLLLAGVFFTQVARTPAMVAGDGAELQGLVEAVAQALAKDPGQLLHPDDWLQIATVAAAEVAANPGRLLTAAASRRRGARHVACDRIDRRSARGRECRTRRGWQRRGRPAARGCSSAPPCVTRSSRCCAPPRATPRRRWPTVAPWRRWRRASQRWCAPKPAPTGARNGCSCIARSWPRS